MDAQFTGAAKAIKQTAELGEIKGVILVEWD